MCGSGLAYWCLSPLQGAPEGILERCKYVRVNGDRRVDLTPEIKEEILDLVRKYGTGKEEQMVN